MASRAAIENSDATRSFVCELFSPWKMCSLYPMTSEMYSEISQCALGMGLFKNYSLY